MTPPSAAERALYADLSRMLHEMRGEPYARVEAAIEARFHAYLRTHGAQRSGGLAITHRMTVHDEAEPWAIYETEFQLIDAAGTGDADAADGASASAPISYANVVPFPAAFRVAAAEPAPGPVARPAPAGRPGRGDERPEEGARR